MASKKKIDDGFLGKASLRNFRVSPRKARLVIDLIRGKRVGSALDILANCEKKTAPVVKKLLLSAVANIQEKEKGIDVDDLFVKSIWVSEGLKFYRFMPRAQGRATPIRKRSSTIEVRLDER
jgi:large subunit ribosomal protein L22